MRKSIEERKAVAHAYYIKHRDEIRQRCRTYYTNPENKKKLAAAQKRRRQQWSPDDRLHALENQRRWNNDHPEYKQRNNIARIKRLFNLSTFAEADQLVEKRKGNCEVCGGRTKHMSIDHDHKTGRVRGILCHFCNSALGLVHDNPDTLRALITYLESSL